MHLIGCKNLLKVEIPDTVTTIGGSAFRQCSKLSYVKLPNNIEFKSIPNLVFQSCNSLLSIDIPDSVTYFGESVFDFCSNLESVKMSKNVSRISGIFQGCEKLAEINLEGNPNFTTKNGIILNKKETEMQFILVSAIKDNTLTIPEGVTTINLGLIDIYDSKIKKVIIPSSLQTVNSRFFTTNIETIEINEGGAYKESEGRIYSKDGTTLYYVYKQGDKLAKDITSITIEDTVKTIGQYALYNCANLKELKIGKGVTNLNYDWDWQRCSKITTITVDKENKVYTAEGTAIYKDNNTQLICVLGPKITNFEIPSSVRTIGKAAFYSQNKLTKITIPKGATQIGSEAFLSCTALEEIEIPQSVTQIGGNAFGSCTSLAKGRGILIDNKLGSIPDPNNNCWGAGAGERVVHWLQSE